MLPIMPSKRVTSLLPLGGSTTYPQMERIGWCHLATILDNSTPSTAVSSPSSSCSFFLLLVLRLLFSCSLFVSYFSCLLILL